MLLTGLFVGTFLTFLLAHVAMQFIAFLLSLAGDDITTEAA